MKKSDAHKQTWRNIRKSLKSILIDICSPHDITPIGGSGLDHNELSCEVSSTSMTQGIRVSIVMQCGSEYKGMLYIEAVDVSSKDILKSFIPTIDGAEDFLYSDNEGINKRIALFKEQTGAFKQLVVEAATALKKTIVLRRGDYELVEIVPNSLSGRISINFELTNIEDDMLQQMKSFLFEKGFYEVKEEA